MRKIFIFLIIVNSVFTACKGKGDKITIKDDKGNKATIDVSDAKEAAKKIEEGNERAAELKKLSPLTLEQLKALLPEELAGMKRNSFNTSSAMGVSVAKGTYKGDDDKELDLEIIDCAGEMGANWYNLNFLNLWSFQQEDDNGYQKTVDYNGGKAIEKYHKANDRYEFTYAGNNRFLVNIDGEKIGLDAIKEVANNLKLKTN